MTTLSVVPRPAFRGLLERLTFGVAWVFLLGACALALAVPMDLMEGPGRPGMPAVVHLFTLGGILGLYELLLLRHWQRLYAGGSARPPGPGVLAPLALGLQTVGVILMACGFYAQRPLLAHIGGHYLVPSAVLLLLLKGLLALWRRAPGALRHLAAHMPGFGLVLAASLGAMLVLDAYQGGYGIYGYGTILVHLLAGAFLFVLPLLLVGPWALRLDAPAAGPATPDAAAEQSARLLRLLPLLAAGVLLVAVGQGLARWPWATPAGLALLGAVCLRVGLPGRGAWQTLSFNTLRRTPWAAVGLLLIFAALRLWRGAASSELLALARFTAVLFLFVAVLPDLLARAGLLLQEGDPPLGPAAPLEGETVPVMVGVHYALQLLGSSLLIAALATRTPELVQAGGAVWLASLLPWGLRHLRR